jgi:hypothetical protein
VNITQLYTLAASPSLLALQMASVVLPQANSQGDHRLSYLFPHWGAARSSVLMYPRIVP